MKSVKTGAISGCVIWILLIGIISSCVLPVFFVVGSITSFSEYAIQTTGKFLCPQDSTPESYSYETTTRDENGNPQPSTAYELHCVDAGGTVVKNDPVVYSFLWIGVFGLIGLIVSGVLTFMLAAPAGALVARLFNRNKTQ